ncbi:MAG: orotate phosphoribosyltransferase [Buchnera aphidicola (Eriosoma harunire)]
MLDFKKEFIEFSLKKKALQFGTFILKSGRNSPYFFNTGNFHTGNDIKKIGYFYATSIINYKIPCNSLFGLAYKGIPITVSTAIALKKKYNLNIPYSFNRKEKKTHGELGSIIGFKPCSNIIIIDDVITAGTTIQSIFKEIHSTHNYKYTTTAIVALNRNEIGYKHCSSIQEIKKKYLCPVYSIITIQDIIEFMIQEKKMLSHLEPLYTYIKKYGAQ